MALSACCTKATVIWNRVATAVNPLARNSPGMDDIGINGLAKMFEPKMFEVAIYSIVVIAIAYWAFLWRMGRRADVLHGGPSRHLQARNLQANAPHPPWISKPL